MPIPVSKHEHRNILGKGNTVGHSQHRQNLDCKSIKKKLFTSSIPTLKPLLHKKCNISLPPPQLSSLQRCKCAARILILCCWALQGYSAVGHCRDTFRLGPAGIFGGRTLGILCGWAVSGYLVVGHCRDTWWLGTAGILGGWALQGYSAVRHCRDTLRLSTSVKHCRGTHWLGTAGILCGWALQGYLVVQHRRDNSWLVTKVSFQLGEDNIYFRI